MAQLGARYIRIVEAGSSNLLCSMGKDPEIAVKSSFRAFFISADKVRDRCKPLIVSRRRMKMFRKQKLFIFGIRLWVCLQLAVLLMLGCFIPAYCESTDYPVNISGVGSSGIDRR